MQLIKAMAPIVPPMARAKPGIRCAVSDEVEPAEVAAESRLVEESAKAFPGIDSLLAASLSLRARLARRRVFCVPSPSCVPAAGLAARQRQDRGR
ncbi:MAG: hypothetical protein ACLR3C_15010 [Eggerthella lenta]